MPPKKQEGLLAEIDAVMSREDGHEHVPRPTPTPTERGLAEYKPGDRPLYANPEQFHAPDKPYRAEPLRPFKIQPEPRPYVPAPDGTSWAHRRPPEGIVSPVWCQMNTADLRAEYEAAKVYDAEIAAAKEIEALEKIPDPEMEEWVREITERLAREQEQDLGPNVSAGKYEA